MANYIPTEAEIKLLQARYDLLNDIHYNQQSLINSLNSKAKEIINLLIACRQEKPESGAEVYTLLLKKTDWHIVMNFLSIARASNLIGYSSEKYDQDRGMTIAIKEDLLKKLS